MIDLHSCLLQWGNKYRRTGPLQIIKCICDPVVAAAAIGLSALSPGSANADTLEWALAQAYMNNPQLNSQRAIARQADEAVPQALSGYRPKVSIDANAGEQYQQTLAKAGRDPATGQQNYTNAQANFAPRSVGL